MDYETIILDKLLDKYEKRVQGSNKRVRIVFSKGEVEIPSIESEEYDDFRNDMLKLKNKGFIDLDWVKNRTNSLINSVWLNLENVQIVYCYLERENVRSKVNAVVKLIDSALDKVEIEWIYSFLEMARNDMIDKNKLTGIWCKEHIFLSNFLSALEGISKLCGRAVSMRAFSVKTYGNSKLFEKEIKQYIIPVIKSHEPNLIDIDEISDREVLAQVGIIMMPEFFEFCGNVKIHFPDGAVDFSPITKGACLSSECIADICWIEILETDRIVFIENKTNYAEYCLNDKTERELVVFHGGFYSPQRGEFFRKLCAKTDIPVYFWGDIDYGGFKMFVRLKNNIISMLQPFNMDIYLYNRYKSNGLKKDDKYISRLKGLCDNSDYRVFDDVINAIVEEKTTVEQESFLEKELVFK